MSELTKLTSKLHKRAYANQTLYIFYCPGCDCGHVYYVIVPDARRRGNDTGWTFDGDIDSPTFTPSLKNTWTEGEEHIPKCCHLIMIAGKINYCSDCTHQLAGQVVDMVDIPDGYGT